MGSSAIPYSTQATSNFQAFPPMGVAVPTSAGMMGNMMGQAMPAMGQNTGMMVGMGIPNGFVGNPPSGVMGLPPNMMGPQATIVSNIGTAPNKFGMQQNQPTPWNLSQVETLVIPAFCHLPFCCTLLQTMNSVIYIIFYKYDLFDLHRH